MQVFENKTIDEKVYIEVLDNGMKVIIAPKKDTNKKYIVWATKYGSIDSHFIEPVNGKEIQVPDGVAHYLEHKMFEQENGVDSLYKMMALGLDANAYTTNNHTAYLFSCTENFYEGLDELMDYVQHPYFTDENVNKERGIIEQEIQMYDDEPAWKLYFNCMNCLYKDNGITIDTAGTKESISHITKEILYDCYNTFYHPSNMVLAVSGDFEPEEILEEIKKRLLPKEKLGEIKRIYPSYEDKINKKEIKQKLDINMPLFMIGYRDFLKDEDFKKKDIAIQIIFDSILGKCTENFQELYEKGLLMRELDCDYEYADQYSHILISGESDKYEELVKLVCEKLENEDITEEDFERSKKRVFGEFVANFNDVTKIARMYMVDDINNINLLDYVDVIKNITIDDVRNIKNKIFKEENRALSIIDNH